MNSNPTLVKRSAKARPKAGENGPVLLSGGNPQIPKGDVGRRLDALVVAAVPGVRKAVKWNSPFYGVEGEGWFLSFHVLTRYVKVTFFKGVTLKPLPRGGTPRSGESRWVDIYEDDALNEAQFTDWIKQAAAIPGWTL